MAGNPPTETQMKTTTRCHFARMAVIKMMDSHKSLQGYRATGTTVPCWWEKWRCHFENVADAYKVKRAPATQSGSPTPGSPPKGDGDTRPHERSRANVHGSTVHNSQRQPNCLLISEWTDCDVHTQWNTTEHEKEHRQGQRVAAKGTGNVLRAGKCIALYCITAQMYKSHSTLY